MSAIGFTLMCEQTGPKELIRYGERAESTGFDFTVISDHFHPWVEQQGNSPFAWSVLGVLASRTTRMPLMTMVTCPTMRYHPAVVAQMAATIAIICDGRFTLGLGAGENLNEHVVGKGWPPANIRHLMLEEAIGIIRKLWEDHYVSHQGDFFSVHNARIFDLPSQPPPIAVAASGRESCRLAARMGAALVAVDPFPELVDMYREAGGTGPCYGQIALCYDRDESRAVKTAHAYQAYALLGWKVMSELPNPVNFEAAVKPIREEDVARVIPCGPSVERYIEGIKKYVDAGFDRIAVLQSGPDQEGFFRFWADELKPGLEKAGLTARAQDAAAPAAGRSSR